MYGNDANEVGVEASIEAGHAFLGENRSEAVEGTFICASGSLQSSLDGVDGEYTGRPNHPLKEKESETCTVIDEEEED